MANIYDNPYYDAIVNPKTPRLALESLYPNFGAPILADRPFAPEYGAEFVENELPYLKELTPTTDMATGIVPELLPDYLNPTYIAKQQMGISSLDPQQKFQFQTSAYEDDEEGDIEALTGEKKSGGIADLLRAALGFVVPGANFFLNKGRDAMSGIRSLNERLRNTDFGQSRTGAEYMMRRKERKQAERAQEAMPDVYRSAREQGFTNDRGGFSTSRADRSGTSLGSGQFSSKRSTGRQGY